MNKKKIILVMFVIMFLIASSWVIPDGPGNNPVAVSPGSDTEAATIWGNCPTFSWSAVDQAAHYRVSLFEVFDPKVASYEEIAAVSTPVISKDIPGPALSWTLPAETGLKTGSMYAWYVRALDASGNPLGNWSNGRIFIVEQEMHFAGIEEKLGEILNNYGISKDTISDVLKDLKSEVKEVVVRETGSTAYAKNSSGIGAVRGYEGASNTAYGLTAGVSITTGNRNSCFGREAGEHTTSGQANTFLGYASGISNNTGSYNTFVGADTGLYHTTGSGNTFIGYEAGFQNTTGNYNTFVGMGSGEFNIYGYSNTFLGYVAGQHNSIGYENTFLGHQAGFLTTAGYSNTFIGKNAGYSNVLGIGNVFLGYNAGYNETDSDKLYIDNSDTDSPLIYGEFDNDIIAINGKLGIGTKTPLGSLEIERTGSNALFIFERTDGAQGKFTARPSEVSIGTGSNHNVQIVANNNIVMTLTPGKYVGIGLSSPSYPLHMQSGAYCSTGGTWTNASSRELKENIEGLSSAEAVDALNNLNPVKYNYKVDKTDRHVGFIAEDVPDLVASADRKGMSPMDVVAVLTRVVQEQQKIISDLQERIEKIEQEK